MDEILQVDVTQNLSLLKELFSCGDTVFFWNYAPDGHLAKTNCGRLVLDTFFRRSCIDSMLLHFQTEDAPIILSGQLGLMWAAAREPQKRTYWVIGPVLNAEMSTADITEAARTLQIDLTWRDDFIQLLESLPTLGNMLFCKYAIMLHYCVTGEKLTHASLSFQGSTLPKSSQDSEKRNRQRVYKTERALLACVRSGDLNYRSVLAKASQLSNGIRVRTKNPVTQAMISASSFTSLCVRAAIEGGLSPEIAYTVGDNYIQGMVNCRTVSDLSSLNHQMFEDFVLRVHAIREMGDLSRMVRDACTYVNFHVEDELSLPLLAKELGYSEGHLSRSFKAETGIGVAQYILSRRVERAKVLLEANDLSVSEIAAALHFCSSSHFSSSFRRLTGMLPQQYRDGHNP
ncbi:MAG: AraC family transcriptional regulator [Muribaculaceae bacterium]|nr:AraC family transcriptional regulator [Muribaculaceae bacterium]